MIYILLLLFQHFYSCLSGSKKHSWKLQLLEELDVVTRGNDVHVEVGDSVEWPVEPGDGLVGVTALLPKHPEPQLLHVSDHLNVIPAQWLDILDAVLFTKKTMWWDVYLIWSSYFGDDKIVMLSSWASVWEHKKPFILKMSWHIIVIMIMTRYLLLSYLR